MITSGPSPLTAAIISSTDRGTRNGFIWLWNQDAESFLRPFVGAREHICKAALALDSCPRTTRRAGRTLRAVVARQRAYSPRSVPCVPPSQQEPAHTKAGGYDRRSTGCERSIPTAPFLVIPEVSSERREYVPIGWLEPPVDSEQQTSSVVLENASSHRFRAADLRYAYGLDAGRDGGRMKSDYRVFRWRRLQHISACRPKAQTCRKLEPLAQAILNARGTHPGCNPGRPVRPRPDAAQSA